MPKFGCALAAERGARRESNLVKLPRVGPPGHLRPSLESPRHPPRSPQPRRSSVGLQRVETLWEELHGVKDVIVRVRVPEWKSRCQFCAGTTPKMSTQPDVKEVTAGNAPRPPLAPRESAPLRPSDPRCPKKTPRRAAARRLSSGSMGSTAPRPPRVQGRRKPSLARPSRGRRRGRPHVERRTAVDSCRHLAPLNSPTPAPGERENARGVLKKSTFTSTSPARVVFVRQGRGC